MNSKLKLSKNSFISFPFLLLVILFFNTNISFSQNIELKNTCINQTLVIGDDNNVTATTSTREVNLETNFNFVSWFMGTKQSVKENTSKETTSTKKLLINSGVAPNRILMKTFLKKAQNLTSSVA
jgi:hypothetical protein